MEKFYLRDELNTTRKASQPPTNFSFRPVRTIFVLNISNYISRYSTSEWTIYDACSRRLHRFPIGIPRIPPTKNNAAVINQITKLWKIDESISHPSLVRIQKEGTFEPCYLVFFAFRAALLPLQYLLELVVLVPQAPYLSAQLLVLPAQLLDVVLTCEPN